MPNKGSVVTGLSQEYTPNKSAVNFEVQVSMAKRSQLQLKKKDLPAASKPRFDFMLDDNDFEEFT